MDLRLLFKVLSLRSALRARERWGRDELATFQRGQVDALRRFAYRYSPFYRRFHQGLEAAPLEALPVLTKAMVMEQFDDLLTDRSLHLTEVEQHLATIKGNEKLHGRYWVSATAGSTGRRGIFLAGFQEWAAVLASYARSQAWGGLEPGLTRRFRLAVVSSTVPWHQSARVGASVQSWWVPTLRIGADAPLPHIVDQLNRWQPEVLVTYASMLGPLAGEQLTGRLHIAPQSIFSASEVLTQPSRERALQAWDVSPFNVYAATETATIASECEHHRLHLFEDLVVTEVMDESNNPVPPGTYGAKVLVTVLFSRTQPLIRYEMSDSIAVSPESCACGRALTVLEGIRGRQEDTLRFPDVTGGVAEVHPSVFHRVMEAFPGGEWQIVQAGDDLEVLVAGAALADAAGLEARLRSALADVGVKPGAITVKPVPAIPRGAAGKAPLIVKGGARTVEKASGQPGGNS